LAEGVHQVGIKRNGKRGARATAVTFCDFEAVPLTSRLTFYTRFGDVIVDIAYAVLGVYFLLALRKKYGIGRTR
jgi:hypothetical protein